MANKLYEESNIQDIADAIREKNGSTDTYSVAQMGNMIRGITEGGSNVFDIIYPVGSIYMSVNESDPSTLFGGTWEQIKDTFLLSAGDIYEVGATGGEATHTLTVEEMPKHTHGAKIYESKGVTASENYSFNTSANWWNDVYANNGRLLEILSNGSSEPHNNMPPYLTVYMWKRTA